MTRLLEAKPFKLGKKLIQKTFLPSKSKLVCHPLVLEPYEAWTLIHKQAFCSSNALKIHLSKSPSIATISIPEEDKPQRSTYYFVNNFWSVHLNSNAHVESLRIAEINDPDTDTIIENAWFECVELMYRPLDHKFGWVSYRDVINDLMPTKLKIKFFGSPSISVDFILQNSGMNHRKLERLRSMYRKEYKDFE